jgi:hypothetical protein
MRVVLAFLALVAAAPADVGATAVAEAPPPSENVTYVPDSSPLWTFWPADRWTERTHSGSRNPNGTEHESKWGSASALIASPVNATRPAPRALGVVYGTGSSNGHARVTINGRVMVDNLDTFSPTTNLSNEVVFPLAGLPNLPLWVLHFEAIGNWTKGSKDSYVEVVGLNIYM